MAGIETEPFYVGEYRHNLDGKNRVTIPSKWRFLGDDSDIYVGWWHPDGYIAVYPPKKIAEFRERIRGIAESDRQGQGILRRLFGKAHQFGCDSQGRIKLHGALVRLAGLTKEVVLVGLGESFNIWNEKAYQDQAGEEFDLLSAMREFGI